ncbi:hypothetical protein D8S78_15950 [Natrialba swarupiae]|nr:hypothetical protein [Natrialba swarupiae]
MPDPLESTSESLLTLFSTRRGALTDESVRNSHGLESRDRLRTVNPVYGNSSLEVSGDITVEADSVDDVPELGIRLPDCDRSRSDA